MKIKNRKFLKIFEVCTLSFLIAPLLSSCLPIPDVRPYFLNLPCLENNESIKIESLNIDIKSKGESATTKQIYTFKNTSDKEIKTRMMILESTEQDNRPAFKINNLEVLPEFQNYTLEDYVKESTLNNSWYFNFTSYKDIFDKYYDEEQIEDINVLMMNLTIEPQKTSVFEINQEIKYGGNIKDDRAYQFRRFRFYIEGSNMSDKLESIKINLSKDKKYRSLWESNIPYKKIDDGYVFEDTTNLPNVFEYEIGITGGEKFLQALGSAPLWILIFIFIVIPLSAIIPTVIFYNKKDKKKL